MVSNIRKVCALIFFSGFICLASSGKSLNGNQINNGSTVKSSVSLLTAPTIVIDHVGLNTIDTLPDYIPPYSEVLVDVIVNGGVDEDDVEPGGVVLNWQVGSQNASVYMRAMPRLYNLLSQNYHYVKRIDPYANATKIYWWVTALNTDGEQSTTEIDSFVIGTLSIDDSFTPNKISISGNFPNPFNPTTKIGFSVLNREEISLKIFSMRGELVRTFSKKYFDSGNHFIEWDGKDEEYNSLPSGVYFYSIDSPNASVTAKMTLLK